VERWTRGYHHGKGVLRRPQYKGGLVTSEKGEMIRPQYYRKFRLRRPEHQGNDGLLGLRSLGKMNWGAVNTRERVY
jgi:hypothetical protein